MGEGDEMMWNHPWHTGRWGLFLTLTALFIVAGCAPTKVTTEAFVHVNRLGSDLQRGVSTKMDVHRILGAPTGFGNAMFPTDPNPREVWFYDDVEATGYRSEGKGVLRVHVRQQVLLVFFERGVFDGYMWFSNAGTAEEKE
jgi:hypothetical protein